jgi:hypothetical protein
MSFWKRNKVLINYIILVVYAMGAILFFIKYREENRMFHLVGSIVFGLSMIIRVIVIIDERKKYRKTNAS